jgi:hypothetical protein
MKPPALWVMHIVSYGAKKLELAKGKTDVEVGAFMF